MNIHHLATGPALLGILFLVAGCGQQEVPVPDIPQGPWRVEFSVPGGMLPVGLALSQGASGLQAEFVNGEERVRVPRVSWAGNTLTLEFPAFNNRLEAIWDGTMLRGILTLVKRGGVLQKIPFTARPGFDYRFAPPQASAGVDVAGRWAVTFADDDGAKTPAIGEFTQEGNRIQGTFLTNTGDYRYLAGEVIGSKMLLSTFDGAHLFLFAADLNEDQILSGDFWSGDAWHETWTAERDAHAELSDAFSLTFIKPGYDGLAFTFPDLNGEPVSLSDSRYSGKVVLVTLAGTWCPNCHDEARFLAPVYRKYHSQGLEVIALLYEHVQGFELAAAQARKFKAELGIDYELLVAGFSDKTSAAETLPMLNKVVAFPTTIFIGRDGEIRRIHTGFTGPGTGEHYTQFTSEFESYIKTLLDEAG